MSAIQVVLFDVGNVILRSTHQITFAILWELGVRPDLVPLFFHQPVYGEFARGKITGEAFAEATRLVLKAPWLTDREIRTAHDAHIYMLDPDVLEIVKSTYMLYGFSLGFVTTTNEWQTERERTFVELKTWGHVVRSHKEGVTKTDPGAWPLILDVFTLSRKVAPSSVLFIDDAPANIAAASAAGCETHLFNTRPQEGARELREVLTARGVLQ